MPEILFSNFTVLQIKLFWFFFFPDRNIDCLNLLLNCGADLDIKDHLGRSVVLRFLPQREC